MPIGRLRDVPAEMDELERRVVAAQYPEGGLVLGACTGLVLALVTVDTLVVVTPVAGSVVGYWSGLRYRHRRLEGLRAEQDAVEGRRTEPDGSAERRTEREERGERGTERDEGE